MTHTLPDRNTLHESRKSMNCSTHPTTLTSITSFALCVIAFLTTNAAGGHSYPTITGERLVEWNIKSSVAYEDPFNQVDVDVVFSRGQHSWRVPAFWRGGSTWTVRFAPPAPGMYYYHLESTDKSNVDLNGHAGQVSVSAYTGDNELLKHGAPRISGNKRYFEHADGTPFFWLGDTFWSGLSSRMPWDDFKTLIADRKSKGFTVVQVVGGLIPSNEEEAPVDPGFCNEGGCVWDKDFTRINPTYFDYADRRVQHIVANGMTPAIVGGWRQVLGQMGVANMKKHWRYLIARYGAYPVFWIIGGEVMDPPLSALGSLKEMFLLADGNTTREGWKLGEWTEVARYVRITDPYHHPMTVHEAPPGHDTAIEDESLTDFDMFQPGHGGWHTIPTEIALLNKHYARTTVTKPLVVGEIGYEGLAGEHYENFQRAAFWLAMLNGAAGFTYGTIETAEAYSDKKPLHRVFWSFSTWQEAMVRPGSTQVGYSATLLRQYEWWRATPHPEWIFPRGTTLLEPNDRVFGFAIDRLEFLNSGKPVPDDQLPLGEWHDRGGDYRLPYAAGIPGALRLIYLPYFGTDRLYQMPTVFGLEPEVLYRAYYWEPSLGVKIELGHILRPARGRVLFRGRLKLDSNLLWILADNVQQKNCVALADFSGKTNTGILLRWRDDSNYVGAFYSPTEKLIYINERLRGIDGPKLGVTSVSEFGTHVRLAAEVRDGAAAVALSDGLHSRGSPIVDVSNVEPGHVGLVASSHSDFSEGTRFEVRQSSELLHDDSLATTLYDAQSAFRGELTPEFGRQKLILLDAYRPPQVPFVRDWVLVLEADH
jgi:hypothetical protein